MDGERARREHWRRAAVLAGDEGVWRAWYDESYPGLEAYVRWRCAGLRDLADEALQETWMTAVRRMRAFRPEAGTFAQWVAGIAANVIRNLLRQRTRRRRRQRPLPADVPTQPQETGAAGEVLERAERVARALAALPEPYEQVLRDRYLDQRGVADIAAERGQTYKSVESLLSRARHAFREAYASDPGAR